MTTPREALAVLVRDLPDGAAVTVPTGWLRDLLGEHQAEDSKPLRIDLTAAEVAERLGRRPSTIRSWCASGELPGAYRMRGNREWRCPLSALEAFLERERLRAASEPASTSDRKPCDLDGWRTPPRSAPAERQP